MFCLGFITWSKASAGDMADSVYTGSMGSVVVQAYHPFEMPLWSTIGGGVLVRRYSPLYSGSQPKFAILTAFHVADVSSEGYYLRACSMLDMEKCVSLGSYISSSTSYLTSEDWAIMPISEYPEGMKPVRIRRGSPPHTGEEVIIIGQPFGHAFLSSGIVSYSGTDMAGTYYIINGFAAPGSSGGGVFDKYGRLVGLVSAIEVHPDPVFSIEYYRTYNSMVIVVPISHADL